MLLDVNLVIAWEIDMGIHTSVDTHSLMNLLMSLK